MNRAEQNLQIAFFDWLRWSEKRYPELKRMHHIPNGGKRSKAEAAIFKAMGVKPGVPDVFLPEPRGMYHGLYIEFKSDGGKPSGSQTEFLDSLREAGYLACVCSSLDKAIKITQQYIKLPKVNLTYLLIDKYGNQFVSECMVKGENEE